MRNLLNCSRTVSAVLVSVALASVVWGGYASAQDHVEPAGTDEHVLEHEIDETVFGDHDEPHEAHPEGVPMNWEGDLALWSLVTFGLFVLLLGKFAWRPLVSGLDSREAGIRRQLEEAHRANQQAQAMLAEHNQKLEATQDQVREILAEARRDAEHTRQEIQSAAQAEADATRKRAIDEIGRAKDHALKEIMDTMSDRVTNATETVLGRTIDSDDQKRLIQESLSQFSSNA